MQYLCNEAQKDYPAYGKYWLIDGIMGQSVAHSYSTFLLI